MSTGRDQFCRKHMLLKSKMAPIHSHFGINLLHILSFKKNCYHLCPYLWLDPHWLIIFLKCEVYCFKQNNIPHFSPLFISSHEVHHKQDMSVLQLSQTWTSTLHVMANILNLHIYVMYLAKLFSKPFLKSFESYHIPQARNWALLI